MVSQIRYLSRLLSLVAFELFSSIKASIKAIMSLFQIKAVMESLRHLITLYFRWLPLELFPSIKAIMSLSNSLYSVVFLFGCLWNSFPSIKPIMSLSNSLYFSLFALELFLHQSHYESLKFRHLITLYFRWFWSMPLEFRHLIFHQSHYESLKLSSNHALLSLVAFETFFLHQSHYESLKFRHLITLYFRWLPLDSFPSINHYGSLKFRHLITLLLSLVAFGTLFPPSKAIMRLSKFIINAPLPLELFSLHQSHMSLSNSVI
ncbi:unnamed protein product [Acanthosepion pharaonis]|uniref:Uncharacterized protein n=1 Tax=Acanthosepion pharaonis TaxID=158019 RepID=A0A812EHL5_ACAPH|nr:unnamed protein product [Sepia pharaonis]